MKILHISDIHYRQSYEPCEKGYKAVLYRMQSPLEPLGRCLAQARPIPTWIACSSPATLPKTGPQRTTPSCGSSLRTR